MACSMKSGLNLSGLREAVLSPKIRGTRGELKLHELPILGDEFMGKPLVLSDQKVRDWSNKAPSNLYIHQAQSSICVSRGLRWWEKTLKPNMVEIQSAQQLVDALVTSGDRLVVVDFYSPGCGGCKALHPKICQLAEMYPNVNFLKVNYGELKTMCHTLHIHVLPFFRFYRGAEGRLCSFSCTNATIKKFKDALAKHGADRCSLGPAKGLDEAEILRLSSTGQLSINLPYVSTGEERVDDEEDVVWRSIRFSGVPGSKMAVKEESAVL